MASKPLQMLKILFTSQLILLILATAGLSAFLWQFYSAELDLDTPLKQIAWGGSVAALATLVGYISAREAFFATDYLARAVLHIARETSTVEAPSSAGLPRRFKFLEDLTDTMYAKVSTPVTEAAAEQAQAVPASTSTGDIPSLARLGVPAIAISASNAVVYANPAAGVYFDFKPDEAVGNDFHSLMNLSFSGGNTFDDWVNACRTDKVTASQSWERVRHTLGKDSLRQFDMVAHFSKDDPSGYDTLLVFIDHTARYTQEDKDIGFVSMAVHELRTPLTAMRGYIEVFEDEIADKLDAEQAAFMNNMSAQAQTLADFVSNILDVARVEENQLRLKLTEENWDDVIRKAVSDMELRARVRGMKINYSIPEDLPTVAVDRVSVYEVLNNLLDNAIKYTHTDQAIEVRTQVKDGVWVETTVTDRGVGIPENVMKHLFHKFYRSHKSNQIAVGTGLGLYLSKAIVKAHGGDIWVTSKEGFGSTFGFTVPVYESVAKDIDSDDNEITREAHGWIKNHSLYRG